MAGRLPHHVFRGLLSVHSRYGLHTRQVTFMTLYTGGSSRFVTSTTAPIATGWSECYQASGERYLSIAGSMVWPLLVATLSAFSIYRGHFKKEEFHVR